MKVIVMLSPAGLTSMGTVNTDMVKALTKIRAEGNPVGIISNRAKPGWFDTAFSGTEVQFLQEPGRQGGAVVARNAKKFGLQPFNTLVLAVTSDDVAMGKNGGALLLGASWSTDPLVKALGVQIDNVTDLLEVVKVSASWEGHWYFSANTSRYDVRALSDLSTKRWGLTAPQQAFAQALTSTVKNGGSKLKALLAVTARSLLMEGFADDSKLLFGTYPSSSSRNDDTEVLSNFVHRLRTTVSRVRMAKEGEPLFIRHTPSLKRSAGGSVDRTDPTEQLMTLHLNPYYSANNRLKGRHIVILDDCTTYGVSFGVAAAFLLAAGAAKVTGVALGKFGNQALHYDINITANPFQPLSAQGFQIMPSRGLGGSVNPMAQLELQDLIG